MSFIGSGIFFVSITWYVYKELGSASSVGMIVLLSSIPGIFISPLAGVLADRFNKKRIVVLMDILRFILIISVFTIIEFNMFSIYYLYVVTVAVTICSNLFFPSFSGLIKISVDKDNLSKVMGANSTSLQLGTIIGSSIAGVLIATISIQGAFLICSLTYLISAMFLGNVRRIRQSETASYEGIRQDIGFYRSLVNGFAYIKENSNIRILILLGLITGTIVSAINTLLSAYTVEVLHSSETVYGILDASYAFGGVVIGLVLVLFKNKITFFKSMLLSTLMLAISFVLLGVSSSIITSIVLLAVIGFTNMYQGIIRKTKLIGMTDFDYIGRVESVNWLVYSTISPLIALVLGIAANIISIDKIFLLMGTILFGLFFVILISSLVYTKEKLYERSDINK